MQFICLILTIIFCMGIAPGTAARTAGNEYQVTVSAIGYGGGGRFTNIAVDPQNPQLLLVGSDVAGVFKSIDGGQSFHLKGKELEGFSVADIAFHPISSQWVFLLANDALYISRNHGETWEKLTTTIHYPSRFFGSHLLVFSEYSLWAATDRNGVFQVALNSPDFKVTPVAGLMGVKINGLAIYDRRLYAATVEGVQRYEGRRWVACNRGLARGDTEVTDIGSLPFKRLFIVTKKGGLHVWVENERQWLRIKPGFLKSLQHQPKSYKALAVHPRNPAILFWGTHPKSWPHQLFSSPDGGRTWDSVESFNLTPSAADYWGVPKTIAGVEEISFAPRNPAHLYLADWWSVWKSIDGGQQWQQLHQGLQNTVISDIKTDPQNPHKIFLSVWDNGLMVSGDGGRSWTRKMKGVLPGHAREVEISPQNPLKMYLLMNPWFKTDKIYVYKSLDGGENWQDISFPVPATPLPSLGYVSGLATNLEIDPRADDTLYVASNGYGIFKTTTGGENWRPINQGLSTPYIKGPDGLLMHPRNSQILYASTQAGGVFKTTDGGRSWKGLNTGTPFTFGLAIDPANPARIMVGHPQKQILLSEDAGRSWKTVQLPGIAPAHMVAHAVAFDPRNPRKVFAGTLAYDYKAADGIFMSNDGGKSFTKIPIHLPQVNINDVHIPPDTDGAVYVGFSGTGLYKIDLQELK